MTSNLASALFGTIIQASFEVMPPPSLLKPASRLHPYMHCTTKGTKVDGISWDNEIGIFFLSF